MKVTGTFAAGLFFLCVWGCAQAGQPRAAEAEVTLDLPGYAGDKVAVLPLVPSCDRGSEVHRPDDLLRPGSTATVTDGRVRLRLTAAPVLLADPSAPAPPDGPDPNSPFCLAAPGPRPLLTYSEVADRLRDLKISLVRTTGRSAARLGSWLESGPAGLRYVDEDVRGAQSAGCDVVVVLHAMTGGPPRPLGAPMPPGGRMPPGARPSRRPPGPMTPSEHKLPDLAKWRRFVQAVAERYDGDGKDDMPGLARPVVGYVIHNEPDFPRFWADTGPNYGRLVAEAAVAVKSAAPKALVVFAGTAGSIKSYLRAGEAPPKGAPDPPMIRGRASAQQEGCLLAAARTAGGDLPKDRHYVDVLDFHYYEDADRWPNIGLLAKYVARTAQDAGWPWAEVWCMETGTWGPSISAMGGGSFGRREQTEKQQACSLVKRYVYGRARGVTRVWWFGMTVEESAGRPMPFDDMALMVGERPRLAYYAYRTMARSLNGCDWAETKLLKDGQDGVYAVQFSRGGHPLWVAWREPTAASSAEEKQRTAPDEW